MNWVRAHYDRVAVIAGALFLLLCSFFIWQSASAFDDTFAALRSGPQKAAEPPAQAVELQAAAEKMRKPSQWAFSGRSGLFVPEKHFIAPNGQPATLQTTEVHPPVPNDWLDQFSLPIAESDVLTQDPDGDGFNNLEEWQGHTNPTEKESRPPYTVKLKLKSYSQEAFPFIFSAAPGAGTYQLNYADLTAPMDGKAHIDRSKDTILAQKGEPITSWDPQQKKTVDTGYRIVDFKEKSEADPNGKATGLVIDTSELTIENTKTKERVKLVKEMPAVSPGAVATFFYPLGQPPEFTVKKDGEFSLPPETEIRYKLVDVQPERAVIVNTQKPNERIEIGPLTP